MIRYPRLLVRPTAPGSSTLRIYWPLKYRPIADDTGRERVPNPFKAHSWLTLPRYLETRSRCDWIDERLRSYSLVTANRRLAVSRWMTRNGFRLDYPGRD